MENKVKRKKAKQNYDYLGLYFSLSKHFATGIISEVWPPDPKTMKQGIGSLEGFNRSREFKRGQILIKRRITRPKTMTKKIKINKSTIFIDGLFQRSDSECNLRLSESGKNAMSK